MDTEDAKKLIRAGSLQVRLRLLEEQKKRDAAAAKAAKLRGANATTSLTDGTSNTASLIKERLQWIEAQQHHTKTLEKTAILVEGGTLEDRMKLLEETRLAKQLHKQAFDPLLMSDDLIRERLKWMDELQQQEQIIAAKTAIVIQGGNLQERLELLEEQRRRQAEKVYTLKAANAEICAQMTDDLIQERLQWMDEQMAKAATIGTSDDRPIEMDGVTLEERKQLLTEQRRREAERLAVRRIVELTDTGTIQQRIQQLAHLQEDAFGSITNEKAKQIVSSDLIAERIHWLKEKMDAMKDRPEKERLEMTHTLVQQRKAWLDEQMKQAAQLPDKERVQVTHGLIQERISWLTQQKSQASADKLKELSLQERTLMTAGLIAERLAYLEQQMMVYQANQDEEAKANIELQINFLEEQQQLTDQMTEEDQAMIVNVLIDEKMQDLEQQKEFLDEITPEQQLLVTQVLMEDRQAWLEGDSDFHNRKRDETKRAQEEATAQLVEEQETMQRIAEEVERSIAFWTAQREAAEFMKDEERAQITSFLIAEHLVTLEMKVAESDDSHVKMQYQQQIDFLTDQLETIDTVDHLLMIDLLVQEKIDSLEQMGIDTLRT